MDCLCCYLPKFKAPADPTDNPPPVCDDCTRHYGSLGEERTRERERAHVGAWIDFHNHVAAGLVAERDAARREIAEEREKVERLTVALRDATRAMTDGYFKAEIRPELRRDLETDLVRDAQSKRDSAYRALAYANGALLDIAELHEGSVTTGKCKCGVPADRCKELAALRPHEPSLMRWERDQIARMREGKPHGLRRDHPEARKYMATRPPYDLWDGLPARPDRADNFARRR